MLQDVACPMLIFHGKRDFILPVKFGRTLHQVRPVLPPRC